MRKGQEKIIQKARKHGLSEEAVCYLSNETKPLWKLNVCLPFLKKHRDFNDFESVDGIINFAVCQGFSRRQISDFFYWTKEPGIKQFLESNSTAEEKHQIFKAIISFGVSYERAAAIVQKNITVNLSYYYWKNTHISDDTEFVLLIEYLQYWSDHHMLDDIKNCYTLDQYLKYVIKYHIGLQDSIESEFDVKKYSWLMVKRYCRSVYDLFGIKENDDLKQSRIYYDTESGRDIKSLIMKETEKLQLSEVTPEINICVTVQTERITINASPAAISIKFERYNKMSFKKYRGEEKFYLKSKSFSAEICRFYDNGMIYAKNEMNKFYPLNIKTISLCYRNMNIGFSSFLSELLEGMADHGSYVIKDLIRYIYDRKLPPAALPPITLNECIGKKNLNHLMHEKYRKSGFINWNKAELWKEYLILKILPLITENSAVRLGFYIKNLESLKNYSGIRNNRDLCRAVMIECIYDGLERESYWKDESGILVDGDNVRNVVKDYVAICNKIRKKVNLRHKSAKKLKEEYASLCCPVCGQDK